MDARDLKVFETVARLGRMGAAAAELNTVQSNVTAHIRRLEEELGLPLFERHARGVKLAAAGNRLLPYARRVSGLLDEATRAARDDGTPTGPLIIGALETTTAMRLSPLLQQYMALYPSVDLTLRSGTTCDLIDQVRAGAFEGAFVCGPIASPELAATPVFAEELVLLSTASLRSFDQVVSPGAEVRIVVLRRGCSYRQRLEDLLARHGLPVVRILEFGTLEAIIGCVAAGLGITLLPQALLDTIGQAERVAVHRLPCEEAMVETVFVRRVDAYFSSALQVFLQLVQEMHEAAPIALPQRRAANRA